MTFTLTARVALLDGEGDRFDATTGSGGQVALGSASTDPPSGMVSPMESVLVALGGCLGMSIAPMLRKMRQSVTSYEIHVTGEETEPWPRVFSSIAVEHVFAGDGLDPAAVERAVTLGETRYCGVSAMLGQAVPITHRITIAPA
ncbi:MAG TPA: OsmC family protein [Ktedonobacterales bacterium]|nr:OsmC family protein [Ktedonobacterales bacterium]